MGREMSVMGREMCECECSHGVFNVGGPDGLSRLELAYILARHLKVDLVLPEEDLKRIEDKVSSKKRQARHKRRARKKRMIIVAT